MSMRDLTVVISEKGYKELQAKVARLEHQLAALSKKPAKVKIDSSGVDAINKKLSNMGRLLKIGVVTAFAYKGAKAFGAWIDKVEELNNKVTQTGLSSDMYQSLVKQAQESGLSVEAITSAMDKFNKVSAANNDTRSADERLLGLANHLQGIKDPAQRASEAIKYLGRSGTQLLPIFMKGAEGVKAMTAELKANGSILSAETIERAAKVDDAFDSIGRTLDSIQSKIFGDIIKGWQDNLSGAAEGADEFKEALESLNTIDFTPLGAALNGLLTLMMKMAVVAAKLFTDTVKAIGDVPVKVELARQEGALKSYKEGRMTEEESKDPTLNINELNRLTIQLERFGSFKKLSENIGEASSKEWERVLIRLAEGSNTIPNEIQAMAVTLRAKYARELLPSIPTTDRGNYKSTGAVFKATKESGGRAGGTSSANFSDPFLSTLIHFKNEFIVFADKLLRAQGIIKGGGVSAAAGGGDINVSVTVNTGVAGDPQTVGSVVAKEIVQELKKLVTANNNAVTAINTHADVVKQATGKTASVVTPASPPIYQFPT